MGCYGIGTGRTAAAAIEQNHDENGIIWPMPLAPFQVAVLPLQVQDPEVAAAAEELYSSLVEMGVEALLDDRNERAGIKFKDIDLIGLPLRVSVSKKTLAQGKAEFKRRDQKGYSDDGPVRGARPDKADQGRDADKTVMMESWE